ncbi:uncharacterized protein LOC114259114 [Camellia sinensis]|uniref:PARP catalytic domain-containing protein n=2 Tax=Camellia sinensis TaxID=4442 RepID=A0A7J7HNC4_CAMSI|nr:uncharacterized protein LOC114259114 [Camellia sinensis]KAF5954363.1 hypothetical protein HYC85_007219 [Camellia sinensis]THG21059.1 hypothetical protein TEA_020544 [Camellia sinensis var. sinensis]
MATGWVKSLQCKSRASDDVVHHHYHHLVASSSCRKSVQSLKDVIETTKQKPRKKPKQPPSPPPHHRQPSSRKSEPSSNHTNRARPSSSARHSLASDPFFPALTELPEGHSSRNVVEIIFHTSWSPKAFSGRIEMVFKVQNLPRTVTRFEEYREILKSMAALSGAASVDGGCEDHARCVADGNEVMRFHCLGQTAGAPGYEAGCGGAWAFHGGKGAICTFSGSGGAHESSGGGRGRRAMLVCRVIAGRVCKQIGLETLLEGRVGFDSVSGENGELLVFDSRAVLPCFLIIYKL